MQQHSLISVTVLAREVRIERAFRILSYFIVTTVGTVKTLYGGLEDRFTNRFVNCPTVVAMVTVVCGGNLIGLFIAHRKP